MTIATAVETPPANPVMGGVRLAVFILVILCFLPLQFLSRVGIGPSQLRLGMWAYRAVGLILNMRLRVHGDVTKNTPTFYVANHTSYLDVIAMGPFVPGLFVAKSEVAGWPVFGALTKIYNTVFVERRAIRAAGQRDMMREKLEGGDSLIMFPEGTSTDGAGVLPFKSSLFSIVEEPLKDGRDVTVQPISVTCSAIGGRQMRDGLRHLYGWYGDMDFAPHLWDAFCTGGFEVDIVFHQPVSGSAMKNRKALADHCERAVKHGVATSLDGRPSIYREAIYA